MGGPQWTFLQLKAEQLNTLWPSPLKQQDLAETFRNLKPGEKAAISGKQTLSGGTLPAI